MSSALWISSGLADIVCKCVHVYQSITKTAVQHKILIHQIPLPAPFVLLFLSSLFFFSYSTVHSGFLFHWINLSRCPAESVLYLDKQKQSIAAWKLYIPFSCGQHHKHIDFTWLLSLYRSLRPRTGAINCNGSVWFESTCLYVSDWNIIVLFTVFTAFCILFFIYTGASQ